MRIIGIIWVTMPQVITTKGTAVVVEENIIITTWATLPIKEDIILKGDQKKKKKKRKRNKNKEQPYVKVNVCNFEIVETCISSVCKFKDLDGQHE